MGGDGGASWIWVLGRWNVVTISRSSLHEDGRKRQLCQQHLVAVLEWPTKSPLLTLGEIGTM